MSGGAFSGHVPGAREYRRLLIGLFFAGVATFAQLYAPQTVLPMLAAEFAVSPATAALAISTATLGLALAVIPWSIVADRIGRVPAMTTGIVAATLLGALAPFSEGIALFLALRFVEGMALGAVPAVALVYLSEEVDARHTATAAGAYIAGTTVGGLLGRVVAGAGGDLLGWRTGAWIAIGVCAASAVLFLWLIPHARGFHPVRIRGQSVPARLIAPLRVGRLWALYAQGFLLMGAFVAVYNYLGFHLIAPPYLLPAWLASMLFLAYLAGTVSSPWAGSLASRFGRYRALLGAVVIASSGAALMLAGSVAVVILGLILFTAGFFGAHAVASGWTPIAAAAGTRAQASSLYYFAYYAGSSLFGWLLGFVFGGAGWGWFIATILATCAAAMLLAAWLLRPTRRRPPRACGGACDE